MAKTVYDEKEIRLQDGKEVSLKPLPIGLLKKLLKAWEAVGEAKTEEDIFDIYIQCVGICLSREFKDDFEKPLTVDGKLADDYYQHLEEILDMPTIYEVLDVCGGLKLNDPNLVSAIEEAALAQTEETGTT